MNLPLNPFVSINATGALPIKLSQNKEGETWQLPSGELVYKSGGEAPSRIYSDGIIINGTTVHSTNVNVDIESLSGSEISYKSNTGALLSNENWFVKKDGIKLVWDSFSDTNLIIKTIPKTETVGKFIVTDFEKEATKTKIMNNVFGTLNVEYKIHEGDALKHTLNFTASSIGTFSLCQEFSNFDYDEIIKQDDDTEKTETIDTKSIISDKIDLVSLDLKSKKNAFDQEIKNDPLLLLPEVVEFKKAGKLVLGEITRGAKTDFQSFEYNSNNKLAIFCYGDFLLNTGQSFLVDPDTYSSNDPTEDGYLVNTDVEGNACSSTVSGRTNNSASLILTVRPTALGECRRSYAEFPTSTIPDSATITNTVIKYHIDYDNLNGRKCSFMPIVNKPSTATNQTLWDDIGDGTPYVSNSTSCSAVGTNLSTDLGTTADSDLQTLLSSNWFGVGIKMGSELRDATMHETTFVAEEGTGTPDPTLEVTYTNIISVTFDINSFNGTQLPTATLIIKNTTNTNSYALNSTGMKLLTGLSGNQNLTISVPVTGGVFVVNKTLNYNPTVTATKTINTSIYNINCVQTGSSGDVELMVNQTIGHTVTNMTRPVCSTSNSQTIVVSWNMTFTKDGTTGASLSSSMIASILNMSAFGKNATKLFVNGTSIATSILGQKITSSAFTIGQGITTYLVKFYLWLDSTPQAPTSLSATSASTSQINLSWSAPSNVGVTPITGYKITRGLDGITFGTIVSADTGTTTTSYSDTGLAVGVTYYYKVQAINSYGVGTLSSSASAVPTAPSVGGGSSGGGGGGTITNNLQQLSIALTPKKLTVIPNQVISGEIEVTWSTGTNFLVKNVNYGTTDFNLKFSLPVTLKGSGKAISTDKILFNMVAPKILTLKSYSIPVTVTGEIDGSTVTQQGTITIDTFGDTNLTLFLILMMIGFTGGAMLYRKYVHKRFFKKHKDGTVLKKLKEFENEFEKPLKNGTSLKNLRKYMP